MKRFAFLAVLLFSSYAQINAQNYKKPEFFAGYSFESLSSGITSSDIKATGATQTSLDNRFKLNGFNVSGAGGTGFSLSGAVGSAVAAITAAFAFRFLGASAVSGALSHSGLAPQTSHMAQDSHFGVSPKCRQIWRWRHFPDSANRRTA